MKSSKGKIYNFLRKHEFMTMATASKKGKPEAATVKYVVDGDSLLMNVTSKKYRKYENLLTNPHVACVLTADHTTLQFDAHSRQVDGPMADEIKTKMLAADPELADYFTDDTVFFVITPSWMRMQNYSKRPIEQFFYEADK